MGRARRGFGTSITGPPTKSRKTSPGTPRPTRSVPVARPRPTERFMALDPTWHVGRAPELVSEDEIETLGRDWPTYQAKTAELLEGAREAAATVEYVSDPGLNIFPYEHELSGERPGSPRKRASKRAFEVLRSSSGRLLAEVSPGGYARLPVRSEQHWDLVGLSTRKDPPELFRVIRV